MDGSRRRRRWSNRTLLPLRSTMQISNTLSCWYCDFKFLIFNEPLFKIGRKYSRYLRVWFSVGTGFSLAALFGATMIILYEVLRLLLVYGGKTLPVSNSLFEFSYLIRGSNMSFFGVVYLCISSLLSLFVHEIGHALAAASEDIHIEYIAVFLAVLFPGALVAFDHASLQALSAVASLRVYCAGIWHNAVFSAICTVTLCLLPHILNPFYIYGEGPMVLNVPLTSPLSGYLSPGDIIVSLDESNIQTTGEWKHRIAMLSEHSKLLDFGHSNGISYRNNGYCVPHSLIQESTHAHLKTSEAHCPSKLSAFLHAPYLGLSNYEDDANINFKKTEESVWCLDAKDIVKLKKCYDYSMEAPRNMSDCNCSKVELCMTPVLLPGIEWVEITFSSAECRKHEKHLDANDSMNGEKNCLQTFVFVGDLNSMVHSIRLTSYQPRHFIELAAYLPNMLEMFLTCSFHVSMLLALLNSLPVFFLDGESIVEGIIHYCFVSLSFSRKRFILRSCLLGGTFVSLCLFIQMLVQPLMSQR